MRYPTSNPLLSLPHAMLLPWWDQGGYKQRSVVTIDESPTMGAVSVRTAVNVVMKFYYRAIGVSITKAEAKDLVMRGVHGSIRHQSEAVREKT